MAADSTTTQPQAHWDRMYDAPKAMTWHSNAQVGRYICKRMYGVEMHWLGWMFQHHLSFKPKRLLSIGCGDGAHELIVARHGFAGHVDAFDVSEVGIRKANEAAAAEKLNASFFVDTFEGFVTRPFPDKYDAVMFVGSLHHVTDLDGVLRKVEALLTDDGVVIYNEYVGPCYIVFPEERVRIINRLLSAIAPQYKVSAEAQWINPSIETVMATDPSEAVRAALIPQFLRMYFDITWEREFGGGLLHPIFQLLDSNKLVESDPGARSVVEMLIAAEELLEETGRLPSDFVIGVCKKRRRRA